MRIKKGGEISEGRTIKTHDDSTVADRSLTLLDLDIKVRYCRGDMIETNVSCDSAFILVAIARIRQAIWFVYIGFPVLTHATW